MLQQEAGSSGEPLRGPVATSEPAIDISAKGKDEPMVQSLPGQNQRLLSWGSVILTHHCRELVLTKRLQQEKDWDT
jgi:hypothetical protein